MINEDLKILKPLRYTRYSPMRRWIVNGLSRFLIRVTRPRKTILRTRMWIEGGDGQRMLLTRYHPKTTTGTRPAVLYCHGGSFQLEETPIHVRMMCDLAEATGHDVYGVRYRLAPKWRHPKGLEDCRAAFQWLSSNRATLDHDRIMLAGDSAGGNLAAMVALGSKDRKDTPVDRVMMIYPVIARDLETPSMAVFTDTPVFNSVLSKSMWAIYCPEDDASCVGLPFDKDALEGFPPTYVETAEFDPLRDEAIMFACALMDAGVVVRTFFTAGTVHGYDGAFMSKTAKIAVEKRAEFLTADLDAILS